MYMYTTCIMRLWCTCADIVTCVRHLCATLYTMHTHTHWQHYCATSTSRTTLLSLYTNRRPGERAEKEKGLDIVIDMKKRKIARELRLRGNIGCSLRIVAYERTHKMLTGRFPRLHSSAPSSLPRFLGSTPRSPRPLPLRSPFVSLPPSSPPSPSPSRFPRPRPAFVYPLVVILKVEKKASPAPASITDHTVKETAWRTPNMNYDDQDQGSVRGQGQGQAGADRQPTNQAGDRGPRRMPDS
jgi:hypothetical protein